MVTDLPNIHGLFDVSIPALHTITTPLTKKIKSEVVLPAGQENSILNSVMGKDAPKLHPSTGSSSSFAVSVGQICYHI